MKRKRFVFFLIILVLIISGFVLGLLKNRVPKDINQEGYVVSQSKNQSFNIVRKDDSTFTLKGLVADGTHYKIAVKVNRKEYVKDITSEPFELDIPMPESVNEAFIDLYYKDSTELAICINAIKAVKDGDEWKLSENENTKFVRKIIDGLDKKDFTYSSSELKSMPQGILTLSDTISKAHSSDYDKAYAIYLWLCEHMFVADGNDEMSMEDVFNTRIVNNKAYVQYFALMLRAQNIPCAVAECDNGYFFNMIYVNDKWLNVQIDRDTFNRYKSHQYIYSRKNLFTHFGVSTDIISANYNVKSAIK